MIALTDKQFISIVLAFMLISGKYITLPLQLPGRTGGLLMKDSLPQRPLMALSVSVTDDICGMKITDPYRSLEDLKDAGVQKWMKSQADYARGTLDLIPGRKKITDIFKGFDERKMFWLDQLKMSEDGGYYYLGKNTGEPHAKLYYRSSYTAKEVLLFDPGIYGSEKGKNWAVMEFEPSPDGKHVLFTISAGGTETGHLLCMDMATFRLLPEVITPVKRHAAWINNTSFTYRTLNSADVHELNRLKLSKGFIHTLTQSRLKDREIFTSSLYPELKIDSNETAVVEHADMSSDYVLGIVFNADRDIKIYSTRVTGFNNVKPVFKELVRKQDEVLDYKIKKNTLFLLTRKDAPNYKILQMDLHHPDLAKAIVIVPEFKGARITDVQVTRDALYISTLKNGVIAGLYRKEYNDKPVEAIALPLPAGSLKFVSAGSNADDLLITVSGWLTDGKTFKYNAVTKQFSPLLLGAALVYPEFNNLAVEEVMIPSYDGTLVPVSLVHQKGLKKDGNNPLWLIGYGSYGRSETPFFSPLVLSFTRFGGIVGIVHVRGGGELGDAWQEAGRKANKPNTWKDFIAAAEHLISEKYTSAKKIGIYGASAGGILVGRAMTERPELFAVAVSGVGLMNAVRFENSPNGGSNAAEFGTVKDSVECRALFEMDAYHHIKEDASYPATLLTAGINDPRVIAWQPAKFAARLLAAAKGGTPVLFLIDYEAGHNPTRSYFADVMSFILWQTGHPDFQPR